MAQQGSRVKAAAVNLLVACLNATLILVLLCLMATYWVLREANGLTDMVAQSLVKITPLTDQAAKMNDHLIGLREDIAAFDPALSDISAPNALKIQARLDGIQSEMALVRAQLSDMSNTLGTLADYAIEKVAFEVKAGVRDLRQCRPPGPLG